MVSSWVGSADSPLSSMFPLTVHRSQQRTACCTLKRDENKKTSELLESFYIVCTASLILAVLTLDSNWLVVRPELWNFLKLWEGLPLQDADAASSRTLQETPILQKLAMLIFAATSPSFKPLQFPCQNPTSSTDLKVFYFILFRHTDFPRKKLILFPLIGFWKVSRKNYRSFPHSPTCGSVLFSISHLLTYNVISLFIMFVVLQPMTSRAFKEDRDFVRF